MSLKKFIHSLLKNVECLENKIETKSIFSQNELNEILKTARSENVKYLQSLSQINKLSAFDISFLLSSVKLDEDKVQTIKLAAKLYKENEFKQVGQTFSDFIFRVGANLEMLDADNLGVFKELVQCQNEVYDFSNILKNPAAHIRQKPARQKAGYAFQRIYIEK